ncbi:hypothetical protein [Neptuniibacter halophilus]|uniref:hypothetical protein n=1 Tax=Neptuniibacter halophilus TaxID=651666 RepID=UPI0025735FD3|nr:hypothetical protein [Neptuniibacter halophilus]
MSVQAVVPLLKVVGGVMAAKTAVEGIKEGNLLKAALGGVGAYMSFTGLSAGAESAGAGAGTATVQETVTGGATASASGAEGVTALTEMQNGIADAMAGKAASGTFTEAVSTGISNANNGIVTNGFLDSVGGAIGDNKLGNFVGSLNDKGNLFGDEGLLDFSGGAASSAGSDSGLFDGLLGSDYVKGQMVSGGLQLYGGKMAGDGLQERAEWELEQQRKDYEEQRARRASVADTSFLKGLRWDEAQGRYVPVMTA